MEQERAPRCVSRRPSDDADERKKLTRRLSADAASKPDQGRMEDGMAPCFVSRRLSAGAVHKLATGKTEADTTLCFAPRRLSADGGDSVFALDPATMEVSEVIPRDFLNCRLCHEEFQEPKLLPCLHSFCHDCLASYLQQRRDSADTEPGSRDPPGLLCPLCGTPAETRDPSRLPDNVLAKRLSYPSCSLSPRDAACCSACRHKGGGQVPTSTHCVNCEESLCAACAELHMQQEETASHRLISLQGRARRRSSSSNANASDGEPAAAGGKNDDGEKAPDELLCRCCPFYDPFDIGSTYCVDCELALCDTCHADHRPDHRCAELSAIANNFVTKIQEPVAHLRRDAQVLARLSAHLDRAERYAGRLLKEVQQKIRHRTQVLCSLISEYESMLVQETERRYKHNLAVIQQRRHDVSQHSACIAAVTELTDKLLQFGSEDEKVAMRRKVGRRVRELYEAELPSAPVELTSLALCEPGVTVETICNLYGELRADVLRPGASRPPLSASHSLDSGRSVSESIEERAAEEAEADGEGSADNKSDVDMLSNSNHSDAFHSCSSSAGLQNGDGEAASLSPSASAAESDARSQQRRSSGEGHERGGVHDIGSPRGSEAGVAAGDGSAEGEACSKEDGSNSSFQSAGSLQDSVATQLLETPRLKVQLPDLISRDSVKGLGVNACGDIIVASKAAAGSSVYLLEHHGIIRGQAVVPPGWSVHSVASDGKVALIVARGDNRYKVKVMSEDGSGAVLADLHVESYGFNFAMATPSGRVLVASSRYARSSQTGKAVRSGGNVAVYDSEGRLERRITNEDLSPAGDCLLQKPHWLAADSRDNIFVADPASHCVVGITAAAVLMFRLGNCDMDSEELYQGPDSVCVDNHGHVLVTDKREGRIDLLNYQGQLLKCLFPSDTVRFVAAAPNKQLVTETTDGYIKFYDYLDNTSA